MSLLEAAHAPIGGCPRRRIAADALVVAPAPALAIGLAAGLSLPLGAASLVVVLIAAGALWRFHHHGARRRFGPANWITLLRLELASLLLLAAGAGDGATDRAWGLFGVVGLALLLDGVDGWLARRRREVSDFGARFDMVADTAFTLVLTIALAAFALVGPWVLAVGLLRPAFVLAGGIWPALAAPLPPSRARKVVCALALTCLVAGLAPPLAALAPVLALTALALLLGSFGRDLRFLWHRWPENAPP